MEPTPELLLGGFGFTKGSLQRVAGAYAKVFCRVRGEPQPKLRLLCGALQGSQGGRGKVITALHCVLLLLPTVLACFISTPMMTKRLQQNGDS